MLEKVAIKFIGANDSRSIVALIHEAFSQDQLTNTIYASQKSARYIANLVALPELQLEHTFVGAWLDTTLVGYAHIRSLKGSSHLNNVVVKPDFQSRGIGKSLVYRWLDTSLIGGYDVASLEVNPNSRDIFDWYKTLGFEEKESRYFYERSPRREQTALLESVELLDWDTAEASQILYDFSRFRLKYKNRYWLVGRLRDKYFRIHSNFPIKLEPRLISIDSSRQLLIESKQPMKDKNLIPINMSRWMEKKLGTNVDVHCDTEKTSI